MASGKEVHVFLSYSVVEYIVLYAAIVHAVSFFI